jgi:hypothetical protein
LIGAVLDSTDLAQHMHQACLTYNMGKQRILKLWESNVSRRQKTTPRIAGKDVPCWPNRCITRLSSRLIQVQISWSDASKAYFYFIIYNYDICYFIQLITWSHVLLKNIHLVFYSNKSNYTSSQNLLQDIIFNGIVASSLSLSCVIGS